MISSAVNVTLTTALELWQSSSSSRETTATQSLSVSHTIDAASSSNASINQIFAILKAANDHGGASTSYRSAVAAYAAETVSTPSGSIGVGVGVATTSPSTISQMESAVSQVNAYLKVSPANATGKQVATADAYVVAVGSAPVSTELDLPVGLPKPTTIAEALQQLSQSANAGVAAAAKSLAQRWIPGDSVDNGGWRGTAAEIAAMNDEPGSLGGTIDFILTEYRDELVQDLANQMVTTEPKVSSHAVGLLSATYNGSFTMINTGSKDLMSSAPGILEDESNTVSYIGSSNISGVSTNWAIVVPSSTTATMSIAAVVKSNPTIS